jgi:hypothetical protein
MVSRLKEMGFSRNSLQFAFSEWAFLAALSRNYQSTVFMMPFLCLSIFVLQKKFGLIR